MLAEDVDLVLNWLVEDFTVEQLRDREFMLNEFLIGPGIDDPWADILREGAIRIRILRKEQPGLWETLLREH